MNITTTTKKKQDVLLVVIFKAFIIVKNLLVSGDRAKFQTSNSLFLFFLLILRTGFFLERV